MPGGSGELDDVERNKTRWAIALTVLGLLLTVLFALTPPQTTHAVVTWTPSTSADSGDFTLTRGWPTSLTASTTCERLRAPQTAVVLDTGALTLNVESSSVVVRLGKEQRTITEAALPAGDCTVTMGFRSADGRVSLTVDGQESSASIERAEYPAITTLSIPPSEPTAVESVAVVTRATAISSQWPRALIGLLALALLVAAALLLVFGSGRAPGRERTWDARLRLIDAVVALPLVAAALLIPAFIDDGWIRLRVLLFPDRGVFGNYYSLFDAWMPQGYVTEWLLHWIVRLGMPFVYLRLIMAVLLIAAWFVLRIFTLGPLAEGRRRILLPAAAMFVAMGAVWLVTLRPEPGIVAILVVAWGALMAFQAGPRPASLIVGLSACGLAVASHQSGWTAIGPATLLIILAWRAWRGSRLALGPAIVSIVISGGFTVMALTAGLNVAMLQDNAKDFSSSEEFGGVFYELSRLSMLVTVYSSARIFAILLLGLVFISATIWLQQMRSAEKVAWAAATLSLVGLLLTSSKWPWHLGAYTVSAVVLTVLAMRFAVDPPPTGRTVPRFTLLLPGAVLLAGLSTTMPASWDLADLTQRPWAELSDTIGGGRNTPIWLVVTALAAVLGVIADRRGVHGWDWVALTAFSLVAVFPLMASLGWIVLDSRDEPGWTMAKQNVEALSGTDTCGALSKTSLVTGFSALPRAADSPAPYRALEPGAFPRAPGRNAAPFTTLETWGTFLIATTGRFATPRYSIGESPSLSVWTAAGATEGPSTTVVFYNRAGFDVKTVPLSMPSDTLWLLNEVPVPSDATQAQVVITDLSTDGDSWAAVSSPVHTTVGSAEEALSNATTYVGALDLVHYPCAHLPVPTAGYWPRTDYLLRGTRFWMGVGTSDTTMTDVGCSTYSDACMVKLDYPMAAVDTVLVTD